jgi:hypothetical protein
MSDPKELSELKELVDIGLVTEVSGIFPLGNREGDQPETAAIRFQMESLSGKIYFASLTVEAARNMVLGLSNWQPVRDLLSERASRLEISNLELPD